MGESHDGRVLVASRSPVKRVILVCGYFVFLACLFEGSARLAFSIPQVAIRLQGNEDYTYRRNWVQSHQQYGLEAYYTFDRYDPSKGWIPKPNVKDLKVFDNKILNTNSKSLRGKRDFSYGRDGERLRILILGDSFTFGDEVSDDETYSSYLQEMLPNAEVINMGVHGYGHDQMLILLKEEGIKYAPDIVILGFLPLDMSRNLLVFRDYAKPRFVLQDGELKLAGTPVPRPEEILKWDWARPRIIDLFSLVKYQLKRLFGIQEQEMKTITTAILTDMIHTIEKIPARPILAYLPRAREIAEPVSVTQGETYLFSVCELNPQAQCFSARPYFAEKIAQGKSFKSNGHWEPEGHRTVAEAIKRYLVDEGHINAPQLLGKLPQELITVETASEGSLASLPTKSRNTRLAIHPDSAVGTDRKRDAQSFHSEVDGFLPLSIHRIRAALRGCLGLIAMACESAKSF